MIRALIIIAVLFAAVFALDALGSVPVSIAIEWPGGAMAPPLRVAVIALILFAIVAAVAWKVVSAILHGPDAVRGFFRARRRDRGYSALSRGMISIGSGDVRRAHRYSDEARKLLPREPLVLLLEAQTAQLEGRSDAARDAFNRMLDDPDTRLLGLRGLFIEATRAGELEASRHYAAEAQKLSPGLPWAGTAVIEYQSAEHDWAGALATLDQNAAAKLIGKAEAKRLRTVLLTARAMEVEDADPSAARSYALEAHRLTPDFVPAAVVAARVLTRLQDNRKAAKVIESVWKKSPHPDLAEAYLHVRTGDSSHDRLQRATTLQALRPHALEGVLAVARAALDAGEFAMAREYLARALRQSTTQRVCLMMADLEEAESGDPGRVREWLGRAVRADRDEAWTADGVVSEAWQPVSPVTGRLDAFEWRVPVASESGATELDGSDLAERAVRPLELPKAAATIDHAPDLDRDGHDRDRPGGGPGLIDDHGTDTAVPDEDGEIREKRATAGRAGTVVTAPGEAAPEPRPGETASPPIAAAAKVAASSRDVGPSGASSAAPPAGPAAPPGMSVAASLGAGGATPLETPAVGEPPIGAAPPGHEQGERHARPEETAPARPVPLPPATVEDPMPFRPDDPGPSRDKAPAASQRPAAAFS